MKDIQLPEILWIIGVALSCIFNTLGLYLLIKIKNKRPMHLLLMNLGVSNLVYSLYPLITRIIQSTALSDRPQWIKAGGLATLVNQYLATALLTVDRVIMVQLHIRYQVALTKRKVGLVTAASWAASLLHILYLMCKSNKYQIFQNIVFAWDIIIITLCILSYSYIFFRVKARKKLLGLNEQHGIKQRLKIEIPLFIVLSWTLLWLIPDILLYAKFAKWSSWFPVLFILNVIIHPMVYIFNPKLFKSQFIKCFCCQRIQERSVKNSSITIQRSMCQTDIELVECA